MGPQALVLQAGQPWHLCLNHKSHTTTTPTQDQLRTCAQGILGMNRLGFLPRWPMLLHLRDWGQYVREDPPGHESHFQSWPGHGVGQLALCGPFQEHDESSPLVYTAA